MNGSPGKGVDTGSSGRKPRKNVALAIICLGAVAISLKLPSLFSLDRSFTSEESKLSPNGQALCSCAEHTFPRRSDEEDRLFTRTWNQTIEFVKDRGLTFLTNETLAFHRDKLSEIERKGIPGMIFECGVAKAGSAIAFAALKHPRRCLHLFDTFEGIPEPSEKDGLDVLNRYKKIQMDKENCRQGLDSCNRDYYGNMNDLLGYDMAQFESAGFNYSQNSVYFHKGLFDDTVWPLGPIAYAHLDGDWYNSTYHMLERLSPHLSKGGYFVLDDVYQWSGSKNAYVDFFSVNFDWLQNENLEQECWTVVTFPDGKKSYFRLILDVRAIAQVIDREEVNLDSEGSTFPRCSADATEETMVPTKRRKESR